MTSQATFYKISWIKNIYYWCACATYQSKKMNFLWKSIILQLVSRSSQQKYFQFCDYNNRLRKTWAVSSQQIISKYSGMVTGRASEHGDCYECRVNPLVQFRQNHENKLWLWPCFWSAVKIGSNRVVKTWVILEIFNSVINKNVS